MTEVEAVAVRKAFADMAELVVNRKNTFRMFYQSGRSGADVVDPNSGITVVAVSKEELPSGSMELRIGDRVVARVT